MIEPIDPQETLEPTFETEVQAIIDDLPTNTAEQLKILRTADELGKEIVEALSKEVPSFYEIYNLYEKMHELVRTISREPMGADDLANVFPTILTRYLLTTENSEKLLNLMAKNVAKIGDVKNKETALNKLGYSLATMNIILAGTRHNLSRFKAFSQQNKQTLFDHLLVDPKLQKSIDPISKKYVLKTEKEDKEFNDILLNTKVNETEETTLLTQYEQDKKNLHKNT